MAGLQSSQFMRVILVESIPAPVARLAQSHNQREEYPPMFIGSVSVPVLLPGQLLVKVGAAGANRMDLLQRAGKYPPPPGASPILGPEASGLVVDGDGYPKGTPVACLLRGGGYAEYVAVDSQLCIPLPPNITVKEGACIPENWLTAYQLLQEVARLSDFAPNGGQHSGIKHALVYAAASGVGVALIQILREFIPSANVLAVAGSDEKLEGCRRLGAKYCLNYKNLSGNMSDEVLKHTGGDGVDLVLDCVGASFFEQTVKSLNTDSTWVLYGALGGHKVNISLAGLLQKRARLLSTTLRNRSREYQVSLVRNFNMEVLPKFKDGRFQILLDSEFPAQFAEDAHKRLEQNLNLGKVVIIMDEEIANMQGKAEPQSV